MYPTSTLGTQRSAGAKTEPRPAPLVSGMTGVVRAVMALDERVAQLEDRLSAVLEPMPAPPSPAGLGLLCAPGGMPPGTRIASLLDAAHAELDRLESRLASILNRLDV